MVLDWWLQVRFWKQVKAKGLDECWEWMGARVGAGYGRFYDGERERGAHRVSFMLANPTAVVKRGDFVRHTCDNPACCNPRHLRCGTPGENSADMVAPGRQARGERINTAKLTEEAVKEITAWYNQGMVSMDEIADTYGVTKQSVQAILKKETWKHVQRPDVTEALQQSSRRAGNKRRGEDGGNARLTEEQVLEIHRLWAEGLGSKQELSAQFGVSLNTIRRIIRGDNWSHLGLSSTEDGRARRYRIARQQAQPEAPVAPADDIRCVQCNEPHDRWDLEYCPACIEGRMGSFERTARQSAAPAVPAWVAPEKAEAFERGTQAAVVALVEALDAAEREAGPPVVLP